MRVLIVEDDCLQADSLTALLQLEGHVARFEGDGLAALTYLAAPSEPLPEAIVLDLCMPGMDGERLLERLDCRDEWRRIPVVLVTAAGLDELAHLRQRWPRVKTLSKPFDPERLLETLEGICPKL